MSYMEGPRGIGGWLAFFLVTLGVITPAANLIGAWATAQDPKLVTAYGDRLQPLLTVEWVLAISIAVACWYCCYRFFAERNWLTVQITVGVLVYLALTAIVLEPIAVVWIGGVPADSLLSAMGPGLIRPLVYTGIWTAYLLRSERVANTYRPQADDDDIGEVFE